MTMWRTRVITPHGPATNMTAVGVALLLANKPGLQVEETPESGEGWWLIGFAPEDTVDWTYEATGGGVIRPAMDTDGRLWILDTPIPD